MENPAPPSEEHVKRERSAKYSNPKPKPPRISEVIKDNGKLIPHAVKLWVESYEKDQRSAMDELLTTLVEDWKCILYMLLDENFSISDKSVTNLVRLLCASVKKAFGERIEVFENNKQDITVAMMKCYPLLLRKFISDKTKVSLLAGTGWRIFLADAFQDLRNVLQLMKEAFFKHGDKDPLRACVKAINFCCKESRGELQDFARNKLKELEDEIIDKLKSAIKEVEDGGDEYSLVNLRRLHELQLSRYVSIDNLHEEIVMVLRNYRNVEDEVVGLLLQLLHFHLAWSLMSIIYGGSVSAASINSFLSKRDTLLSELDKIRSEFVGKARELLFVFLFLSPT
ncbi:hypothetical protein MtrunA17_Chr3g0098271 [Medicago truncatula]|uniref:Cohesin subunit SCC3/SA HEAT-repeats domain-containing protein n=1 Tax=Medicago truncatula TaxID=3880 RepID=A0A396IRC1_MEDTR|nr:hypothetical protein MtrunA17_Chr3g0098271 [Medicago truncatula]